MPYGLLTPLHRFGISFKNKVPKFWNFENLLGLAVCLNNMRFQRGLTLFGLFGCLPVVFAQGPVPAGRAVAVSEDPVVSARQVQIDLDPQRDMVMSGKLAYLLLPQQFVCGPKILEEVWSPDGKHLAVLRETVDLTADETSQFMLGTGDPTALDPEVEILVWSAVTQKTTLITKFKKAVGTVSDMTWIAGSSSLVIRQDVPDQGNGVGAHNAIIVLSKTGQHANVRIVEPQEYDEVIPSPNRPIVALVEHRPFDIVDPSTAPPGVTALQAVGSDAKPQRQPPKVQFFGADGSLSQSITLLKNGGMPFWSMNGQFYIGYRERVAKGQPPKTSWYLVDRSAGKIVEAATPPDMAALAANERSPDLVIQDLAPRLAYKKVGARAPTVIVSKLQAKDDEMAVVSTDADSGQVSPTYNAVSYRSQGSEMVRPLVKVSLEAYKRVRVAAIRSKTIERAKKVALGLIMYAGDYDDNYVSNAGNWQSQVEPYVGDPNLFDGFNLTFAGGSATGIENPAETPLGYIEGPGGRAVAYADGHVRWIPNP